MNLLKPIALIVGVILALYVVVWVGIWRWMICRQYCPPGHSLQVTRVLGDQAPLDAYAGPEQKGVQEQLAGPGRHFLSPFSYNVQEIEDVVIKPGQVGLVVNRLGHDLPPGRFMAGPDEKGTQRTVLTPGVWRINPHGQTVEILDATEIRPGHIGVQTLREGDGKGILHETLQPGFYLNNERQLLIQPLEIGYQVWTVTAEYTVEERRTAAGVRFPYKVFRPDTGLTFPLADGKEMRIDFTVVWGIFPENAARIITEYGSVDMVRSKIIEPQVLSICKNLGSNLTTKEFIEGESRERFQERVTVALKEMGERKGLKILIALVRNFHPAEDIKATIQARMLAEEEKETLRIEQTTDEVAARLKQAEKIVDVAVKDFDGETKAILAKEKEEGLKRAAEIMAEADRMVMERIKEEKRLGAESVRIEGAAKAEVIEADKKAEATELQLLIAAYGGAAAYNLSVFAESLPADLAIRYLTHGQGTLWTDPDAALGPLSEKKILEQSQDTATPAERKR